jgi:hypothetical protein
MEDKRWSDRFLPEIMGILGEHLISEPPVEEDAEHNTDLMVLRLEAIRIGCRIRKHKYLSKYGDEFTIRAGRPTGAKTELTKIIEGWGDYFFYGFADEKEQALARWILGDLRAFRLYFNRQLTCNEGRLPGTEQRNGDHSSWFRAFMYKDIPGFLIASKI